MKSIFENLWKEITSRRKKQLILILILTFLASIAEAFSVGAVVPFIAVITNPDVIFQHEFSQPFILFFDITEKNQLLLPVTILFVIASIVAGVIRMALIWSQTRLAHAIGADISYQIYKRTLYQPYSVHISRNSSEVIAGITTKANQLVKAVVLPILTIISSILMISAIILTLGTISPMMSTMAILGFGLIYGALTVLTKRQLINNSRKISEKSNETIKVMQEGLGGIRDILIDGLQSTYCNIFRSADQARRRATANNQIISLAPRYIVESFAVALMAVLAFFFMGTGKGAVETLPLLGMLAIGAQRVLPMLNQTYASWSQVRGSQVMLQDALMLLNQKLPNYSIDQTAKNIPFQNSIKINSLSFHYQANDPWALRDISFEIKKGSRVGFIGSTGSGKSTLLDVIMALLHPSEGSLTIDGIEINNENEHMWRAHIAHIPQFIYLSDSTILENIAFGVPKDKINYERVVDSAKKAQMGKVIDRMEDGYKTIVGECGVKLSGGQRQRIGIARALYKSADVLIFDEATSSLDYKTERDVMNSINEIHESITILIVAHRLTTLEKCDSIIELEGGYIKKQSKPSVILK
jgi:ATP-binding cassette, subfamily B, bacterial PglK